MDPSCADGLPSFKINPGPSRASLFCCKAVVLYAGQAGTGRNSSGVGCPFAPNDNEAFTLETPVDMLHAPLRPVAPRIATIAQTPRSPRRVPERQGFCGLGLFTALPLACELGDFRRFEHPRSLMAYVGLIPSEPSCGPCMRCGPITKTGSTFARKALGSAAWY